MKQDRLISLLAALLAIAVVAVYANHFQNGFHFDDSHTIVNNIFIKDIRNIPLFFRDGTTFSSLPTNQSYRPFVSTTLAIDYWLGKGSGTMFFFHLSTFLFFLLQGLFMYFFYRRIYSISFKHEWIDLTALFSVAWYLLHPANAETINYIIARSDSLSTFCIVLSFVLYIYSPLGKKWHLYLVPVAIGALAKPIAVVFGPLLLVYILLFEEKASLGDLIGEKGLTHLRSGLRKALPAILFSLFMIVFIKSMDPPTWTPGGTSRFHYLITQPYVVLHYFTTFFLPVQLSADTDLKTLNSMADHRFFFGTAFILILLFAAAVSSKQEKTRPISFGILWFSITLLPTSLIPLAEVMNDHRIFLPYVGLTMSVCWSLTLLLVSAKKSVGSDQVFNRLTIAVILILLAAYAYGTHQRNDVWKTEETLWHDVAEKSPENGRGLMNYGLTLMAKGDYAGAEKYFKRALELTPNYPTLHINMGVLKAALGNAAEAEEYFRKAISLGPGYPDCYFYYGRFLKEQGRLDEAVGNLYKTVELAAAHLQARYLLMDIYLKQRNYRKLAGLADETLRIVPNDRQSVYYLSEAKNGNPGQSTAKRPSYGNGAAERFLNLSLQYYQSGQYEKSIEAAREALKLNPDYDLAYNNICAAYNKLEQWDLAIEAGEKAVHLNPNNEIAINNLRWSINQKKISGRKP